MNENEIAYLEKALTNEKNENIMELSFKDVERKKQQILEELNLTKVELKKILKKLDDYRYIDELPELQQGRYLRWINLTNPAKLKLTNGGILCDVKLEDNVVLVLKNNMNIIFHINMDKCLIFQKFSDQERVILYAVDFVKNQKNQKNQ